MNLIKEPEAKPLRKDQLRAICIVFEVCETIANVFSQVDAFEVGAPTEATATLCELERDLSGYFDSALAIEVPWDRIAWIVQQRVPDPIKTRFIQSKR